MLLRSLILFFIFNLSINAATHLFLFGGSGDSEKMSDGSPRLKTTSDFEFFQWGNFATKAKDYHTKVMFDGGHKETDEDLRMLFKKGQIASPTFESSAFNKEVNEYIRKLERNELTSKDQIILVANSHGGKNKPGELTHSIAVGSISANRGREKSLSISLDNLQKLSELAKSKKIKLGIIDFSCNSGNSLKLSNEYTCVITSTSENQLGYSNLVETFTGQFSKNLKRGKSLEEMFLKAKKSYSARDDLSFAMISSPAGIITQQKLQPVLNYTKTLENGDGLKNSIPATAQSPQLLCLHKQQFDNLLKRIADIEGILSFSSGKKFDLLKTKLSEYHRFQLQLIKELSPSGDLKRKEKFCSKLNVASNCINYSWQEILLTDLDKVKEQASTLLQFTNDKDKSQLQSNLENIEQAIAKKKELQQKHPNIFGNNQAVTIQANIDKSKVMAQNLNKLIRDFYLETYELMKARTVKEKNPCKEIIL